jgi:hypothetical protein
VVAGYVGAWVVSGEGSSRGGGGVGKRIYNLLISCLCMCREEGEHCCSKRYYFGVLLFFFFLKKERKCNWEEPKNRL